MPAQIDHPAEQTQYVGNIWDAMSSDFSLPDETPENPNVRKQINWYVSHPGYLRQVAEQARPYLFYIYQQVKLRNLPAELALIPMVESAYNPFAYSQPGAAGLWQMMPGTASGFGLKVDWWYDGRRDIMASTKSALDYLAYLNHFFHGDWLAAIAAYDTGEGNLNAAIKKNLKAGKPIDFWHLPLSSETKSYVPKLLALATIIKNIDDYPLALPPIENAPYLASVDVGSQIDLEHAARMAAISLQELTELNPGFNRWATDPKGPHLLLLPVDKAAGFKKQLAKIPMSRRVTWQRYKVKKGDSLISVAKRFKTSVDIIRSVNRISGHVLHNGQVLLIPSSSSHITKIILASEKKYFSHHTTLPEIKITHHVVRPGDTLAKIAKQYEVKPRQIRFWNGIKHEKDLKVGKELIIWPPKHYFKYRVYTTLYKVKKGDSLISIAKRYHISVTTIRKENHLHHSSIRLGQTLKLPGGWLSQAKSKKSRVHITHTGHKKVIKKKVTHHSVKKSAPHKIMHRVKTGETLSAIAHQYRVRVSDIKRWNKIDPSKQLKSNQLLVIFAP